ncbi:EF-hand domain-containing protein [Rhizorhabdus dicambivorans]|uniref:Calcium-binding protein n=1 Tax=Rhizorhabdus dicambivorans TaxID=1850238 RepID=A0A2A4G0K6_9SPHN|nr:EF-hand domain-containing protein [Rhizorhabdus dicambivorans]ATE63325.1 calcium-binding protein [Rhizorhabdus dicambivorans]PCE43539.1 calcium-binding protein [Rhizorhabdus dicambivorans]
MTKTRWIAGAALAATLAAATAFAAPGERSDGPPRTRAEVQAKIADHFKKLDANGDGYVTKDEAEAARAKKRAAFAEKRQERRAEHFAMLDKDSNGALSKDEYMAPRAPRDGERGHRFGGQHRGGHGMKMGHGGFGGRMFERADANKDGKVSLAEAQAPALAMFDRVDANRDGTISPEEHKAARDAMRAKWKEQREARDKQG